MLQPDPVGAAHAGESTLPAVASPCIARTSLPAEPSAGALAAAGGRCSPLAAALVFAAADMRRLRLDDATRLVAVSRV